MAIFTALTDKIQRLKLPDLRNHFQDNCQGQEELSGVSCHVHELQPFSGNLLLSCFLNALLVALEEICARVPLEKLLGKPSIKALIVYSRFVSVHPSSTLFI